MPRRRTYRRVHYRRSYRRRSGSADAAGCIAGLMALALGLVAVAVAVTVAVCKACVAAATWIAHWDMRRQQRKGTLSAGIGEPPVSSWLKAWGAVGGVVLAFVIVTASAAALSGPHTDQAGQTADTYAATSYVMSSDSQPATATAIPPTAAPVPTDTPLPPTATPIPLYCDSSGVPCNPWRYTFNDTGNVVYNPPSNFCVYFHPCIGNFWNGTGYVDQCADGSYGQSGGHIGACSTHGGERRPVYQA